MTFELQTSVYGSNETFELARSLVPHLEKGDVIGLTGPLGAGKTVFVKGVAAGLGMKNPWENVTSPTYTLQDIYRLDETLFHCDAYRLEQEDQFYTLGWSEQFSKGITAIEWVDRFMPDIEEHVSLFVHMEYVDEQIRGISFRTDSNRLLSGLEDLRTHEMKDE